MSKVKRLRESISNHQRIDLDRKKKQGERIPNGVEEAQKDFRSADLIGKQCREMFQRRFFTTSCW